MEIKHLKQMFKDGFLVSAKVQPAPMEQDKFILVFGKVNGGEEQVTRVRDDECKIYRRYTGAVLDAQEIGFKKVELNFD